MKIEPLFSLYGMSGDAWRRLQGFLSSVERGQNVDYVTPFLPKDRRSDQIQYGHHLRNAYALSNVELLNDIEEKEAAKFGPFSVRAPFNVRYEHVVTYFSQKKVEMSPSLRYAFRRVAALLPKASLTPLDLDLSYKMSPKGKNLGLPVFSSDRTFESDYLLRIKSIAASGWKEDIYPAVIGWRGQPNGSTTLIKNRDVWMMDHAETYGSTGVIQVLLDALRMKPGFAAWNNLSVVDARITSILDRSRYPIMSVDFSGFDASLPETIIRLAFSLLRYWFVKSAHQQIDWMERQFLTTDLVTPKGIITGRTGGVPSGSGSTNMVDSLSQLIAANAMAYDLGYNIVDIEVLGDDGVWSFDSLVDVDAIGSYFLEELGMLVSADKGGFSLESVQFLQRLHSKRHRRNGLCVGMRSIVRTLNGICHLERLSRGLPPEFFSARAIMASENAKNHPRFPDLVRFLYHSDKFMRDLDPAEIFMRAGGVNKVEVELGLRSYRFTDELPSSGLSKFSTVMELRKLRQGNGKFAA